MPFEVAPQEQSAAQKLAALIEAGRACNPNMKHVRSTFGDGKESGCAMTFAFTAAGIDMLDVGGPSAATHMLAEKMGVAFNDLKPLMDQVVGANDSGKASLQEIAQGLRAGTLPTYVHIGFGFVNVMSKAQAMKLYPAVKEMAGTDLVFTYFGDPSNFDSGILKPKAEKIAQPAKKVRTSAKTGATWPVAKHCYA